MSATAENSSPYTSRHRETDDSVPWTADFSFGVLGPLKIRHGADEVVLATSKPAVLLGTLLLHANEGVSRRYLTEALWGDQPPAVASGAIHAAMMRLRKLLHKYDIGQGENGIIETIPDGYRIRADHRSLDLLAFRDEVRLARLETTPAAELRLLRSALSRWRGSPLANLNSPVLHGGVAGTVVEERLTALARCHEIELALGNCAAVIPALRALTREYPGDERLAAQLIEALYRGDRQSEALSAYQVVSAYLRDSFGVDPGPGLQNLHLSMVRGEELGAARAPVTAPAAQLDAAPVAAPVAPCTLPPGLRDFSGRRVEIGHLSALLREQGPLLLVLSGLPGAGKTALAVHLAHLLAASFPGGRYFADAATAEPPVEPLSPAGRSLLVLDNVRSSAQVLPLLPSSPLCTVVLTSRVSLADLAVNRAAVMYRLGSLERAESLEFLGAALGEARIAAEPAAANRLAAVCGDHPLALRLAATRSLLRPGQCLAAAVDVAGGSPSTLVVGGALGASVATLFDDYLAGLSTADQNALRLLASTRQPRFAPSDCASVLGVGQGEVLALLDRLVEANALECADGGRYLVPELLRIHLNDRTGDGAQRASEPSRDGQQA